MKEYNYQFIARFLDRLYSLSYVIGVEAARYAKESFSTVYFESKYIIKLLAIGLENKSQTETRLNDALRRLENLAVNARIFSFHNGMEGKSMTSIYMEISDLVKQLILIMGDKEKEAYQPYAEPKKLGTVYSDLLYTFTATIGGNRFSENIWFLNGITSMDDPALKISEKVAIYHGKRYAYLDVYKQCGFELPNDRNCMRVILIRCMWNVKMTIYAIPIDNSNADAVHHGWGGVFTEPCGGFPEQYVRAAWDCKDNKQTQFIDWPKMAR